MLFSDTFALILLDTSCFRNGVGKAWVQYSCDEVQPSESILPKNDFSKAKSSSRTTSLAQALVPKNINTNLCNNTYLLSPPTAAAQEKYTSFQTLYIEYCMNTVYSNFHSSQTLYFPIISHFQEYFTLACKNILRGQS